MPAPFSKQYPENYYVRAGQSAQMMEGHDPPESSSRNL